ncbi:MAG: hypothetical protein WA733_03050 [Methylocystis sp.]
MATSATGAVAAAATLVPLSSR